MAVRFLARLRDREGVDVNLRTFYENPTPAELAVAVLEAAAAAVDESELERALAEVQSLRQQGAVAAVADDEATGTEGGP